MEMNQTGMRVAMVARHGAGNVRVVDGWVEVAGYRRDGSIVWHRAGRVEQM